MSICQILWLKKCISEKMQLHSDIVLLLDVCLYICKFWVSIDGFLGPSVGVSIGWLYTIMKMIAINPNAVRRW